jgi:hypothetical protein
LWPILILHSAMLPINIRRYRQLVQGHRDPTTADAEAPVPSRPTRNVIEAALGRLRCWQQRVVPAPSPAMFARRPGELRRRNAALYADPLRSTRRSGLMVSS